MTEVGDTVFKSWVIVRSQVWAEILQGPKPHQGINGGM